MNNQDIDILVVGGGIVGAAMLCALAPLGKRVLLVDEKPARAEVGVDFDARTLTLSRSSIAILKQLGVWSLLEPLITPIRMIHVSEQGALGRACLYPERQEALLGAVIEISHLKKALFATLNPSAYLPEAKLTAFNADLKEACIETPTGIRRVTADVVIAADGTDSSLRAWCHLSAQEKRYSEEALVTNVGLMRPHGEIAYERFTPQGPMALLPMPNLRAGVVWVQSLKRIQQLKQLTDADFLATLQREFGYRLGRFTQVGSRLVYPLRQVVMPECVQKGVVFIGNAAHTVHPVAGQGFNLGLRDVALLAQCLHTRGLTEESLLYYQEQRQMDQRLVTELTDGLINLYANRSLGLMMMRRLGLMLFDNSVWLKSILSRYASGLGGVVPDLVCNIPLIVNDA